MIIRNAEKHEMEFLRQQRIEAYTSHRDSIPDDHWKGLKKAISSDADQQTGVDLIVAEVGGDLLGSVALFPPQSDAYEGNVEELEYPEIRMLAVAPEAQGKGIASRLIEECINRTKDKGYTAIGLHTGEFMKDAMRLYERFGFKRMPKYDFVPANDGIVVKAYRLILKR
ncbi:GNAT family N-acetyltransferase [Evansella tamaricis]|uniref:GNAT family N-acetyltransferase n=1 Tax=Evansella tamaricis TaxID=2069301 RepID=A0ABS6JK01_9BACI|nr:GNAT family N-acetyltransferase [Evansella tamaricis]MBU9713968.1 GNAT family N-acetyltransferase [Evansella tamaricis]